MKAIRYIAFSLVLMAQMVIMVHNAIPHHHHHHLREECHASCTCHEHVHGTDTETHLCDSPGCETCTLLSDPFENHSQSFGQTILSKHIRLFLPENGKSIFGAPVIIGNILQKASGPNGLRAPPSYL